MTVVLTIRDVPEEVRDALARQARERGQSLHEFLLTMLRRQADFGRNRQLLAEIGQELDGGGATDQDDPEPAELIERARVERPFRPDRDAL